MEGALSALKTLTVDFQLTPGVPSMLAWALGKGAAPALKAPTYWVFEGE